MYQDHQNTFHSVLKNTTLALDDAVAQLEEATGNTNQDKHAARVVLAALAAYTEDGTEESALALLLRETTAPVGAYSPDAGEYVAQVYDAQVVATTEGDVVAVSYDREAWELVDDA